MSSSDPESLAKLIVSRFIERRDAKAVQTSNGAYMPVREDARNTNSALIPWRLSDVIDHVEGRKTYGHYLVSLDDTCRCIVFDCDLRDEEVQISPNRPEVILNPRQVWQAGGDSPERRELAMQLRVTAEGFARAARKLLDAPTMVAYSGSKGMHAYVCLDRGTRAADAREAAMAVIAGLEVIVPDRGKNFFKHVDALPAVSIELYPKQDEVKGGFGNLVRLPLGVNRKTGGRGFFLDINDGRDPKIKIDDPILALQEGSIRA